MRSRLLVILLLLVVGCQAHREATPEPAATPAVPSEAPAQPALDWLAIGGGGTPDSNEASIEADLALGLEVFGAPKALLFAGGPDTKSVQVRDKEYPKDDLRQRLGALFAPRSGRDAKYRETTLSVTAASTRDNVLATLRAETQSGGPLLVFLNGHGNMGEEPAQNLWSSWGNDVVTVAEFEDALGPRPTVWVATTCFSGGFAEMAFDEADSSRRKAPSGPRCGVFSSPSDLESSGCDPDPDRRNHEGYAKHFFNALRGRDKEGAALPLADLDLDGDGRISLLEAHTRVRIATESIDVPTTTSERWLREVTRDDELEIGALPEDLGLVEDLAVAKALSARLKLKPEQALEGYIAVDEYLASVQKEADEALLIEDEAYREVTGALLSRWPSLDDPWRADFDALLAAEGPAIETFLDESKSVQVLEEAMAEVDTLNAQADALKVRRAPFETLVRAVETLALAQILKARGGDDWQRYQELLECERAFSLPKTGG